MYYEINYKKLGGVLPLPIQTFDFLKECSGDYLKILIFILGSKSKPSLDDIANFLSIDAKIVKDAVRYWNCKGFVSLNNTISSTVKPNPSQISTDELIVAKENDKNASLLFDQAEFLYNRPLKPSERRNLLFILDTTNLDVDVILMAIDYCIRIEKFSSRYLLKVCENWDDLNIYSHEQAEKHIKYLIEKNNFERLVCNTFGIHNRKLSANEVKSIEKWRKEYEFSIDIIETAFNRCIDTIGKLSFPYISKILSKWHKAGVNSVEQIKKLDINFKKNNDQTQKENASYDIEEFAKRGFFIKEQNINLE